jgi:hypothetical protein
MPGRYVLDIPAVRWAIIAIAVIVPLVCVILLVHAP